MKHVPLPHLPAADLGLTEDELHALLWVVERLEDGRIADDEFDMDYPSKDASPCGTACCIFGYMRPHLDDAWLSNYADKPIDDLFNPPIERREINGEVHAIQHRAWTCNRHTAARACRQFLATGAVDWDAAIDGRA